jgi:hypothetical protein
MLNNMLISIDLIKPILCLFYKYFFFYMKDPDAESTNNLCISYLRVLYNLKGLTNVLLLMYNQLMKKQELIYFAIFIFLTGTIYLILSYQAILAQLQFSFTNLGDQHSNITPTLSSSTFTLDTSYWRTYQNKEYSFTLSFPHNWEIKILDKNNIKLEGIDEKFPEIGANYYDIKIINSSFENFQYPIVVDGGHKSQIFSYDETKNDWFIKEESGKINDGALRRLSTKSGLNYYAFNPFHSAGGTYIYIIPLYKYMILQASAQGDVPTITFERVLSTVSLIQSSTTLTR